jgi:hypothetical protein
MTRANILEGIFERGTLAHTIQSLAASSREGRLMLRCSHHHANLVFFDGDVIAATCEPLADAPLSEPISGEAAIAEVMTFTDGQFEFIRLLINPGSFPAATRVSKMVSNLFMSSASAPAVSETPATWQINAQSVPTLQPPQHGNGVQLEQMAWTLMPKLTGQHSVREIAQALQLEEGLVIRELEALLANDLISVTQRLSTVAPELIDAIRRVVVQVTGPMGEFVLEDIGDDLSVDLRDMPSKMLREFLTRIQAQMPKERQAVYDNSINQVLKHFKLI